MLGIVDCLNLAMIDALATADRDKRSAIDKVLWDWQVSAEVPQSSAGNRRITVAKLLEVSKSFESTLLGFTFSGRLEAALANGVCEMVYHFTDVFPADTCICNA